MFAVTFNINPVVSVQWPKDNPDGVPLEVMTASLGQATPTGRTLLLAKRRRRFFTRYFRHTRLHEKLRVKACIG